MARRRTRHPARNAALVLAVLGAGAGALAAARRQNPERPQAPRWRPRGARRAAHETWTCACGTSFRTTGSGRHQVFWLQDAPEHEPVLGDRCPTCERPLPGSAPVEEPAGAQASQAGPSA